MYHFRIKGCHLKEEKLLTKDCEKLVAFWKFFNAYQTKGKWITVLYSEGSLYPVFDTTEFDYTCILKELQNKACGLNVQSRKKIIDFHVFPGFYFVAVLHRNSYPWLLPSSSRRIQKPILADYGNHEAIHAWCSVTLVILLLWSTATHRST